MKQPKQKLEVQSMEQYRRKVSKVGLNNKTSEKFRTKDNETIDSRELWAFVEDKIKSGDKSEELLEKRIAKELKLQYKDVDKVIDALRELIMPVEDDKTVELARARRNKMIQEIIAAVQAEEDERSRVV